MDVGNILSSIKKREVVEQKEVKCRPLTQIFTQGKVYTYPELEISKDRKIDKTNGRSSSYVIYERRKFEFELEFK